MTMAEELTVEIDEDFGKPKSKTNPRLCATCGTELDDRRKTYCDDCKETQNVGRQSATTTTRPSGGRVTSRKGKGGRSKVTDATQRGMTSIVGKLLYLVTLLIAWSALRNVGVPDYNGDIADTMALTDDEAEMIGRPLSRIFLRTEGGRKMAPVLVENEDAIDAAFALWDWYRRMTTTMDQYHREMIAPNAMDTPPPMRRTDERRNNSNGNTRQTEEDRSEGEGGNVYGYVPPSPIDLIGA